MGIAPSPNTREARTLRGSSDGVVMRRELLGRGVQPEAVALALALDALADAGVLGELLGGGADHGEKPVARRLLGQERRAGDRVERDVERLLAARHRDPDVG